MAANKRIVLFKGDLDTVNLFSCQLKLGFLELGYEIFEFDLSQSAKSLGLLYQFIQDDPVTAMIAFNSPFFGMELPSGEKIWEILNIPCVNILLDHPYWYHSLLMRTPKTGIVLCIDRNHMNYISRFYPHIPTSGFLPHGGTESKQCPPPISERSIDILYAGSLYAKDSTARQPDFSQWDFPAAQICEKTIRQLLLHPKNTIEDELENQLRLSGMRLPDDELRRFISSAVYIERVVSSHYREKILSSIAKAGLSLTLYGNGWQDCDWITLPNVCYKGRVSPAQIVDLMRESRLVLNTLPWFKDGSHERIFNAMLNGAVCVSETSAYLEEILSKDAWVSFDLSENSLTRLPLRLKNLLADSKKLQAIASAGYQAACSSHTWKARALELHRDLLSFLPF